MKPENKFRTWFVDHFNGYLNDVKPRATFVAKKHADYATSGILDMSLTINGTTVWTEFKLIPQCVYERKLEVSALQRVEIEVYTAAGAPAIVLVGLPLGPRLGYQAAIFQPPIPGKVVREDFNDIETIFYSLYAIAEKSALRSVDKFLTQSVSR